MPIKVKSPIIDFYGLRTPFRCGLFGSSRTGKTSMIYSLLSHRMFDSDFEVIYYCYPSTYSHDLNWHNKLDYTIEYLDHIPNQTELANMEDNSLVILDDCWYDACSSPHTRDLFKVLSE